MRALERYLAHAKVLARSFPTRKAHTLYSSHVADTRSNELAGMSLTQARVSFDSPAPGVPTGLLSPSCQVRSFASTEGRDEPAVAAPIKRILGSLWGRLDGSYPVLLLLYVGLFPSETCFNILLLLFSRGFFCT